MPPIEDTPRSPDAPGTAPPDPIGTTTEDTLLNGRVRLRQPLQGLRAGLDAVLLAASIPARPGQTVLEGGCGTGAVFLCLLARVPDLHIIAIERDPDLADLARHNAEQNGVAARVTILTGDIADATLLRTHPRPHHACANPPYWPGGTTPPTRLRANATHAGTGPLLEDWATALATPLMHKGTLTFVLPAGRFSEAATALRDARCGGVSLLPLWPRAGQPARRILIQARRGTRQPDHLHPGLALHDGPAWTPEATAILRDAAPLTLR
jgi:tRNA1(Val) A37 N6-methylase TrmN6